MDNSNVMVVVGTLGSNVTKLPKDLVIVSISEVEAAALEMVLALPGSVLEAYGLNKPKVAKVKAPKVKADAVALIQG